MPCFALTSWRRISRGLRMDVELQRRQLQTSRWPGPRTAPAPRHWHGEARAADRWLMMSSTERQGRQRQVRSGLGLLDHRLVYAGRSTTARRTKFRISVMWSAPAAGSGAVPGCPSGPLSMPSCAWTDCRAHAL